MVCFLIIHLPEYPAKEVFNLALNYIKTHTQ